MRASFLPPAPTLQAAATLPLRRFSVALRGSSVSPATFTVTVNGTFTAAPVLVIDTDGKTYTITASIPAADSYDLYWITGTEISAADIKAATNKITGAVSGGTISGPGNSAAYSAVVTANKAYYASIDSAIATGTAPSADEEDFGSGASITETTMGAGENLQGYLNRLASGNYAVTLTGNPAAFIGPGVTLSSGVTVSLRGSYTIDVRNAEMFNIPTIYGASMHNALSSGTALSIRGPTLQGKSGNTASLVKVSGGYGYGGGVYGSIAKTGGTI